MPLRPLNASDLEAVNRLHRSVWWPERSTAGWRWLMTNPAAAEIDIYLAPDRKKTTDENKQNAREFLKDFSYATPLVLSLTGSSANQNYPFQMVVSGNDLATVEATAEKIIPEVMKSKNLMNVDSTMKKGNPEMRIILDPVRMQRFGVTPAVAGKELRYRVAGSTPAIFKSGSMEYNIRTRLKPEQRDLRYNYSTMKVPNISGAMVPLSLVSDVQQTTGSVAVYRLDRSYVVKITAQESPKGGVGNAMTEVNELIKKNVQIPSGVTVGYTGMSEEMSRTVSSALFAILLAILFIYMILASLYESFITPFTILLAIPPAMTGALFSLAVTGKNLDINAMIGMLLLMGLVTKNSILLVDFAAEGVRSGMTRKEAVLEAGRKRLRPILMTTFAMLAGMVPLSLGIGQAAAQRQGMGIAIMGGLIVSTVITLVVVPSVFEYIDRFREWVETPFSLKEDEEPSTNEDVQNEKPKGRKRKLLK